MSEFNYEFVVEDAAKSYVRLSKAGRHGEALSSVLDALTAEAREVDVFAKRVRLPGSALVARLFGRLEAWKAARVERQAQAAVGSLQAPTRVTYTFKSGDVDSVRRAFKSVADAAKRGAS